MLVSRIRATGEEQINGHDFNEHAANAYRDFQTTEQALGGIYFSAARKTGSNTSAWRMKPKSVACEASFAPSASVP